MITEEYRFIHQGRKLVGLLDKPMQLATSGICVILVHGHGHTDVVAGNWYAEIRRAFTNAGLLCLTWDKPGCGSSEGPYDHDQTVQDSANEVHAAISQLTVDGIATQKQISLWGISRAGWINALVIQKCPDIAFWISVSPGGESDNYPYQLRVNLKLEGRSNEYIDILMEDRRRSENLMNEGVPYEVFAESRKRYLADPWVQLSPIGPRSQTDYEREVSKRQQGRPTLPPGIRGVLSAIHCPVLAMFGEKDLFVDWRDSLALYEETLGKHGDLTVLTFSDMNHGLSHCETGGLRELIEKKQWNMDAICIHAIEEWLYQRGWTQQGVREDVPSERHST